MPRRLLLCAAFLLAALVAVLPAAPGGAHPGEAHNVAEPRAIGGKGVFSNLAGVRQARAAEALTRFARPRQAAAPAGPCTEAAAKAMPLGDGHRHSDIAAHAFACRMEQVAFVPLLEQLRDRPNVILGEMDVKAGIAAIEITYPQAGVLFFNVSDPSKPRFLSRYDATECDQLLQDINCGAFVDLAPDGKTAYLSIQKLTLLPTLPLDRNALNQAGPGVDVIDIANPRRPVRTQFYPILGLGGVHTVRSHTIPAGPSSSDKPRAAGEYVISNQNGVGIDIAKVTKVAGKRVLTTVRNILSRDLTATIVNNEVHDTFIQNDPLDGRTYLYNAAGFSTGFSVYDITDPTRIRQVAEWDLTPECEDDWYAHTIDVTHRDGRRYVTMPAEMLLMVDKNTPTGLAEMTAEDQAAGCGTFVGNGDKPGPLWIVDATDFAKLGPANDRKTAAEAEATDAALKKASQDALVATWTNPAGRAGGSLTFSPHNQQIVGDRIYLSHYHGGVYVLDASAAFAGRRERPKELGFIVPHDRRTRPLLGQPPLTGLLGRFFTDFPLGRPEIWDMVVYKGHVLASDMTGGLYSLRYDDSAAALCTDARRPRSVLSRRRSRLRADRILLRGTASDRGCSAGSATRKRPGSVRKVSVAVARKSGSRCRFLSRRGTFGRPRACSRPVYLRARGTRSWRLLLKGSFPAGTYRVSVSARDGAGNRERAKTATLRLRGRRR
ncbi:MAG: LVIVD repeat-containing protein [Thermoleophilia bacterium]